MIVVVIEYREAWPADCVEGYEGWNEWDFFCTAEFDGWPGEAEFFA